MPTVLRRKVSHEKTRIGDFVVEQQKLDRAIQIPHCPWMSVPSFPAIAAFSKAKTAPFHLLEAYQISVTHNG